MVAKVGLGLVVKSSFKTAPEPGMEVLSNMRLSPSPGVVPPQLVQLAAVLKLAELLPFHRQLLPDAKATDEFIANGRPNPNAATRQACKNLFIFILFHSIFVVNISFLLL